MNKTPGMLNRFTCLLVGSLLAGGVQAQLQLGLPVNRPRRCCRWPTRLSRDNGRPIVDVQGPAVKGPLDISPAPPGKHLDALP